MIEQKKFMSYGTFMMKRIMFTLIFAVVASLWIFGASAEIYKAVDGDSLEHGDRRIRLDGIDAPEFVQMCYNADDSEYTCGVDALKYLENLLHDSTVRCDCLMAKDKYGREICECFADDVSINEAMVFGGYAVTYRSDKYINAEREAKEYKRGIWRGKFMRPALFRALERLQNKTAAKG